MAAPLLTTKLYIPRPRASLMPRPRLQARLRQGLAGPLTLVAAPPGFGKTTLVSESVAGLDQPLAWLSLDEDDSDPVRFGAYFVAALQTLQPELGENVLALLRSPQPPPLETALALLVNDIAATLPPFVFVLDDYHVIDAPPIHSALAFLLDHLPAQMHLVIASRADPPLPLARWRVRGQLTELRADDLRFTPAEAAAFLQPLGLQLAAEDVAALEARTEGWAAGLQLAALALQQLGTDSASAAHAFIAAFAGDNRFILDYLTEEVLRRQPETVQAFLLHTSILERLTGPLCDAVTEQTGGQALLEALERANLFLAPLDSQRRWYRYHRLFADLLRYRLQQNEPERAPELHCRAAAWLEQNGLPAEAVPHALQAQAFDLAARLIEDQAEGLLLRGETATLAGWGKGLPAAVLGAHPKLAIFQASAVLIGGDLETGGQLLDMADAGLAQLAPEAEPGLKRLLGQTDAIRSIVTVAQGDLSRAIALAQRALERLPEDDRLWRNVASIGLANSYRTVGDIIAAEQIYARIAAGSEAQGSYYTAVLAAFAQGSSLEEQGRLRQAEAVYQRSLELARRWNQGNPQASPTEGLALAGLAGLNYEWNNLEIARRQTETALQLGERGRIADILTNGYVTLAHLQQAQGDETAALQTAGRQLPFVTTAYQAATKAFQVYLWLKQGQLAPVAEWVKTYRPPPYPLDSPYEFEARVLARALLALGRGDEALGLIGNLRAQAERIGRRQSVMELWRLEALAQQAQGNEPAALAALEQALRLAEPEGYIRSFVDEGEPMRRLLAACRSRLDSPALAVASYIEKLLAAFDQPALPAPAQASLQPPSAENQVEPLSDREREVLRLLAANRSNLEIAEALVVSINTVKTHINRLYTKLDAHSRLEAVERARQLGWL